MTQNEFNSQWRSIVGEDFGPPACPKGMVLLKSFADNHPTYFKFIRAQDYISLDRDIFNGIQEWEAFAAHVSNCLDCNESDETLVTEK